MPGIPGLRATQLLFLVGMGLLLTSCATQPYVDAYDPPGFFMGLLHGFLAPWAIIGGLFMDVRVYAFPNSGWFYDLGFMLGLLPWGGGAAAAGR